MNKNSAFKIYSGDYSKDGYNYGIEDRKENKPKNRFKFFKAVNPINYVWAFNNAYESFMKSYDKGYMDGQRVEHNIYHSNQTKGTGMANDSYDNQLRMLDDFGRNLVALRASMISLRDKYKRQIDVMGSAGFMDDYTSVLETKYYGLSSKIEDINTMIERQNSKLDNHKEIISNLKSMARSD
ncbi:MAG: Unknown protein [uncultured Sulfurovum sp.]|uniref:Uncharacterized protein n=1 Tax=uncultured Sulfurovum sp. TaxID=269237 RepID=A0A6S6SM87_9BACT|nr:MAG: Unknown protein [uncultured Sulfurovum sp.]